MKGLGEPKGYYCGPDPIWLDEDGNITSRCREEFPKSSSVKSQKVVQSKEYGHYRLVSGDGV